MSVNSYCLVMAGGGGTRFWPESYSKRPKQYLKLVGSNTLLRETLLRFDGIVDKKNRYIVTVKQQEDLAVESGNGEIASDKGIIFEPSGRNTAPCILLSLAHLVSSGASLDDVVSIVPADHVILDQKGFKKSLTKASLAATEFKKIITIGVRPNFPHTGYGYIEKGIEFQDGIFEVSSFKEKPSRDIATTYVQSGNYYWNAGMFVATIGVLLEEFKSCSPEIFKYYQDLLDGIDDFKKVSEIYEQIPTDSIDYAIMEKSNRVMTIPANFDWNDLGSWDALESVIERVDDNVIADASGHYFDRAYGNIVFTPGKFVSLIGVSDLIVVSNDRAVIVLPKSDSQKVKEIVEHLKQDKNSQII